MADDRPANDDLPTVLAELRREVADLKSTALVRASRCPTGTVEASTLDNPKADTLLLDGRTLQAADYPALHAWLTTNSPRGFAVSATTFTLPDWRGRAPVGATAARPAGTLFGASERVILPANMAAHTHQVEFRDHASSTGQTPAEVGSNTRGHNHGNTGASGGNHGDHNHTNLSVAIGTAGNQYVLRTATTGFGNEGHVHGTGGDNQTHDHYLFIPPHSKTSEVVVGSNTPLNIEGPSVSVNWLIWC